MKMKMKRVKLGAMTGGLGMEKGEKDSRVEPSWGNVDQKAF
jgi:hypothetical protein